MPRRIVLACLLAVLFTAVGAVGTFAFGEWREAQIVDDLTRGGQVVYLRHADRHRGAKETLNEYSPLAAFEDCKNQRNLTAEGREDAAQIGETFRRWNVPVGKVVALPLCRTRETASLAFGPDVILDAKLYSVDHLRKLVAQQPRQGNTILVGSEDQLFRLVGTKLKPGEAAVFRPDGRAGFRYLGDLDQDDLDP
jgi:phosphohistidine phosphatase SixA